MKGVTTREGLPDPHSPSRHAAIPRPIVPVAASLLRCLIIVLTLSTAAGCARHRGASRGPADLLDGDVVEGRVMEGEIARAGPKVAGGVPGYRVQLFASTVPEEAEQVARLVRGLFTERVYIDHSEPYYKIRIGNYATLEAAEAMRKRVAEIGYEDAWVIETAIEAE